MKKIIVKDVVEPMIAQILIKRPKNVAKFMLSYLKSTYNRRDPSEIKEHSENEDSVEVRI